MNRNREVWRERGGRIGRVRGDRSARRGQGGGRGGGQGDRRGAGRGDFAELSKEQKRSKSLEHPAKLESLQVRNQQRHPQETGFENPLTATHTDAGKFVVEDSPTGQGDANDAPPLRLDGVSSQPTSSVFEKTVEIVKQRDVSKKLAPHAQLESREASSITRSHDERRFENSNSRTPKRKPTASEPDHRFALQPEWRETERVKPAGGICDEEKIDTREKHELEKDQHERVAQGVWLKKQGHCENKESAVSGVTSQQARDAKLRAARRDDYHQDHSWMERCISM